MSNIKEIECIEKSLNFLYELKVKPNEFNNNQIEIKLKIKITEDLKSLLELYKNKKKKVSELKIDNNKVICDYGKNLGAFTNFS